MYLSKLILNPRNRMVQRDLSDIHRLHETIMRAFTAMEPGRVLYRLESGTDEIRVIVQSRNVPEWSLIEPNYFLEEPSYKMVELKLRAGQKLRFRLRANPTVKSGGKREGILREDDQLSWLNRKGMANGFEVIEVRPHSQRMEYGKGRNGNEVRLFCVTFDGILSVTDPDKVIDAVENGIGSGKGFGNGLLSLARAE
jgi:CRISPR system Cascade subunit CasE